MERLTREEHMALLKANIVNRNPDEPKVQDPGISVRKGNRILYFKRRSGGILVMEATVVNGEKPFEWVGAKIVTSNVFEELWKMTVDKTWR